MRPDSSLESEYFESMFARNPDPWGFETSRYESDKYDATIAALGDRRYRRALEVGCANGVLTRRLAPLCTGLLAIDVSTTALARAKRRCADMPNVAFATMVFPKATPAGATFDLIMLSEVAYYWDLADLQTAGTWIADNLSGGGDLLLVHWTGETDYPHSGDEAVGILAESLADRVEVVAGRREPNYRLDLWRRR